MITHIRLLTAISLTVALFTSGQAAARTNMLFILDASNSMWGQVDGKSKISSAQEVLGTLLTDLPADTSIGLMTYGHRDKASCTDIELLSPIGTDSPDSLTTKINGIQPKGKTPIAAALKSSVDAFAKNEGESNHVVLISDGLESCDGDPCAAAGLLASANIKARVHVVGFDVGEEERKKLECIPEMGNGKYFSATNAAELKVAVAEVKKEAVKPAPAAPVVEEYFRDDFDGEELADHWEVLNPNPDSFIVENGELVAINSSVGQLATENVANVFRLTTPMPEGDWTMTAKVTVEFQTSKEFFFLGLFHNKDTYIIGNAWAPVVWNMPAILKISSVKRSKAKDTAFEKDVWTDGKNHHAAGLTYTEAMAHIPQPLLLRLSKKGRSYIVSAKLEDAEDAGWVEVEKLTSLRSKGDLAFGLSQSAETKGESLVHVDWVKIETSE